MIGGQLLIKVIGNENCSRCEMTKRILTQNNIEFEYDLFSNLDNQLEIRKQAMAKGMLNFPIVLKDGEMVELQEVLA